MIRTVVKPNSYLDSVFLMAIAGKVQDLDGIRQVSCLMATEENKKLLESSGLLSGEATTAGPNDLVISIEGTDEATLDVAVETAGRLLAEKRGRGTEEAGRPANLSAALEVNPEANLALISLPGQYVRREADKALAAGLNVFIFSDNVPLADEIALKQAATARGLLVMGPDCGTGIVNGAAVGFANVVRSGSIGIVAAAGTGLQEVACLIHRGGGGISQGIGTGGRDLKEEVGGLTMKAAMALLEEDPATSTIVLVSKPPAASVAKQIIDLALAGRKRYVINFIGAEPGESRANIVFAECLEVAAMKALAPEAESGITESCLAEARERTLVSARATWHAVPPGRRYVRGLFSGGTLCYEAQFVMNRFCGEDVVLYSSTPFGRTRKLKDSGTSVANTLLDLGEDEFTVGRPHPMIDFALRNQRIRAEADDPKTALILLDVVLGHGAHPNPAGELVDSIRYARDRKIAVATSICGTDQDPQDYARQVSLLEEAGAQVKQSNAELARFAGAIANRLSGLRA